MTMAEIEDPTPPPPTRYVENAIETGDGRHPCRACSKHHGSVNAHIQCLERALDSYKGRVRHHEEELARVRREVRGEMLVEANPGGTILLPKVDVAPAVDVKPQEKP